MTNLISAMAISFTIATAPEKPLEKVEESTVYVETLAFTRCEIADPTIGFYGKGNCDKVIKAYAQYKQLRAQK